LRAAPSAPHLLERKEELEVPEQALIDAGYSPEEAKKTKIYHGKGCSTCNKADTKARTGLYEVIGN